MWPTGPFLCVENQALVILMGATNLTHLKACFLCPGGFSERFVAVSRHFWQDIPNIFNWSLVQQTCSKILTSNVLPLKKNFKLCSIRIHIIVDKMKSRLTYFSKCLRCGSGIHSYTECGQSTLIRKRVGLSYRTWIFETARLDPCSFPKQVEIQYTNWFSASIYLGREWLTLPSH